MKKLYVITYAADGSWYAKAYARIEDRRPITVHGDERALRHPRRQEAQRWYNRKSAALRWAAKRASEYALVDG